MLVNCAPEPLKTLDILVEPGFDQCFNEQKEPLKHMVQVKLLLAIKHSIMINLMSRLLYIFFLVPSIIGKSAGRFFNSFAKIRNNFLHEIFFKILINVFVIFKYVPHRFFQSIPFVVYLIA